MTSYSKTQSGIMRLIVADQSRPIPQSHLAEAKTRIILSVIQANYGLLMYNIPMSSSEVCQSQSIMTTRTCHTLSKLSVFTARRSLQQLGADAGLIRQKKNGPITGNTSPSVSHLSN